MVKSTEVSTRYRPKLAKDIKRLIEEGKKRAANAAGQELILTYWQIGKRLSEENITENAGYQAALLSDLAKTINLDSSTLKRCLYFFQTYISAPRSTNLSWSHYKHLISIKDTDERNYYQSLVEKRKLTRDQLASAIQRDSYSLDSRSDKPLKAPKLSRPTTPTYLYKATVERVIDGDTLLLNIDLGFQVFKQQRIRLAEIDAPEIEEKEGEKAYLFVLNEMAKIEFVMVKTNKVDIYGRYVGAIFYSLDETDKNTIFSKGRYLNQELLDRGLAEIL